MAKATKHPVENYTVTLELSQEEAEVLRCLVGNIVGSTSTARGVTDQICDALITVGVPYVNHRISGKADAS